MPGHNQTGGNKHKKQAKKNGFSANHLGRARKADDSIGEIYAVVCKLLGGSNVSVLTMGATEPEVCRIGGKFRKNKAQNRLVAGGLVLVGKNGDFVTSLELLEVYSSGDTDNIRNDNRNVAAWLMTAGNDKYSRDKKDDGVDFSDRAQTAINKRVQDDIDAVPAQTIPTAAFNDGDDEYGVDVDFSDI